MKMPFYILWVDRFNEDGKIKGISKNPEKYLRNNGWKKSTDQNTGLWEKVENGCSLWARIEKVEGLK